MEQKIGNYKLLRLLGEGGMGAVYEGVHEAIERHVAIKVLHPEYARRPEFCARFFNEPRQQKSLSRNGKNRASGKASGKNFQAAYRVGHVLLANGRDSATSMIMQNSKLPLFLFNALGGAAVLGSYVHGFLTHPHPGRTLWGGVPKSLRPLYAGSMWAAAGGFIAMINYLSKLPEKETRIFGGRLPLSAIYGPLGVIHAASTLWMPLTFAYADSRSAARWAAVRIDLALVGLGALALIPAVATATPRGKGYTAALVGAGAFAFHTVVLDALVWPALYRKDEP